MFRSIAGVLIYCIQLFPIFNAIGLIAIDPVEENVKLSKKEKLVEQGAAQYQKEEHDQATKTLNMQKRFFPANYTMPQYPGLIYLEEGWRFDAIANCQQYVLMNPKCGKSLKIIEYLTLHITTGSLADPEKKNLQIVSIVADN